MKNIFFYYIFICLLSSLFISCDFSDSKINSQKEILIIKFDSTLNSSSGLLSNSYGIITGLDIYFYINDSVDRTSLIPTIFYNGGMLKYNDIKKGDIVLSNETSLDFSADETPLFVIATNTSNRKYNCKIVNSPDFLPKVSIPFGEQNNYFTYISGGTFIMGSEELSGDAIPEHLVTLSPFFISEYEVSNGEFAEVMNWAYFQGMLSIDNNLGQVFSNIAGVSEVLFGYGDSSSRLIAVDEGGLSCEVGYENYPVTNCSWYGAMFFCYFVNLKEGFDFPFSPAMNNLDFKDNGYRLPTEAEWEFSAKRDGDGNVEKGNLISRDLSGTDIEYCLFKDNSESVLNEDRGTLLPNKMGLYDMSGSCLEWVCDSYQAYTSSPFLNPIFLNYSLVVVRGGSYKMSLESCFTSVRKSLNKKDFSSDTGFRVVRSSFEGR